MYLLVANESGLAEIDVFFSAILLLTVPGVLLERSLVYQAKVVSAQQS